MAQIKGLLKAYYACLRLSVCRQGRHIAATYTCSPASARTTYEKRQKELAVRPAPGSKVCPKCSQAFLKLRSLSGHFQIVTPHAFGFPRGDHHDQQEVGDRQREEHVDVKDIGLTRHCDSERLNLGLLI